MEKDYPIKIVQGNYFAIALPLSKIVWSNGSKTEQPLVPNKGDLITVNLVSSSRRYDMRKIYVEDNVVHYECNEYLDLGTYSIELRLILVDGKKYRSYQRNKIQIVATNEEADIKDGNEFGVDTYEISSAVILYAKGDKGDQGDRGPTGSRGPVGPAGPRGFRGEDGQDGLSAYEIAVEQGFVGTEEEWLLSLKGDKGEDGTTDYNELENTPTFKTINGETITGEGDIVIEGGSSVNLEYYSEDTERGTAKIDIGNCSADFDPIDAGTITIFATHTDIHDDGRNSQLTVGGGVSINTKNGNRLTYNNVEVATKSDISNCATQSQLNAHTTDNNIHVTYGDKINWNTHLSNNNIHVTAADKTRWDGKQDSGDYATNSQLSTHTSNTTVHVTAEDKANWNAKQESGNYAKVDITNTFTNPQLINAPIGNNNKVWKNVYQPFFQKRIHTAVIYTSIPYGGKMPYLRFMGNPYKNGKIVDFGLTWYVYNDNFINYGCCNNGTFLPPSIYLFSYTKNNSKYVAIGLYTGGEYSDSWYYMTFNIDVYSIQQQLLSTSVSGWTNSYIEQSDTTTKLIPDVGTDDCVLVPQKPILSDINGDSTSVNGYSITNVTALPSNPNANTIYLITDN